MSTGQVLRPRIARYGRRHASAAELHRPTPPARGARAPRDAGHEPAVVVGRQHPRPVPLGRSRRVGRHAPRPGAPARHSSRRSGSSALAADPAFLRFLGRGRTTSCTRYLEAPRWFQTRGRVAAAPGGLLLARVRHRRGAPAVLRRPRRPRRRPPEGGQRPRRAARRRRPLLPPRLLPPGASTPTAGSRSATPTSTRTPWRCTPVRGRPGHGRPGRRRRSTAQVWRADVGRMPLYLLDADVEENPPTTCAASPTGSTAATSSTGCARRSCSASAACGRSRRSASTPRCSTPTRATPASSASSASAGCIVDDGLTFAEAVEAVRAGCIFTTHTPVPGRHRPLPARADRALLRRLGRRVRRHARRAHGARPPTRRRRARRALQHGGDGPAPRRPLQRACPSCTAR